MHLRRICVLIILLTVFNFNISFGALSTHGCDVEGPKGPDCPWWWDIWTKWGSDEPEETERPVRERWYYWLYLVYMESCDVEGPKGPDCPWWWDIWTKWGSDEPEKETERPVRERWYYWLYLVYMESESVGTSDTQYIMGNTTQVVTQNGDNNIPYDERHFNNAKPEQSMPDVKYRPIAITYKTVKPDQEHEGEFKQNIALDLYTNHTGAFDLDAIHSPAAEGETAIHYMEYRVATIQIEVKVRARMNTYRIPGYTRTVIISLIVFLLGVRASFGSQKKLTLPEPEIKQEIIATPPTRSVRNTRFSHGFKTYKMLDSDRGDMFVKCLRDRAPDTTKIRFFREKATLKTLRELKGTESHVNMILQDWSSEYDQIAMPCIPYGNLICSLKNDRGTFDFQAQMSVFKQVLSVVEWLHKAGWAHLNIQPEAIFVIKKWSWVKLGKFHNSVKTDKASTEYDVHPSCRPPEVLANSKLASPCDAKKADLWALGAILYFLFSKKLYTERDPKNTLTELRACSSLNESPGDRQRLIDLVMNLLFSEANHRPKFSTLKRAVSAF